MFKLIFLFFIRFLYFIIYNNSNYKQLNNNEYEYELRNNIITIIYMTGYFFLI